jgi:uncharacterized membrane protein
MKYLISLYTKILDWIEPYEPQIEWFVLGVVTVTIFILILNAEWLIAGIYAALTYINYRIAMYNQ